jgi:16S rRNA (cytosine967-C5)-methyltransferase
VSGWVDGLVNTRLIAARVIVKTLKHGEVLNANLDQALISVASPQERAFIKAVVFGVCRTYHRLECILHQLTAKPVKSPEVKALILIGLYQLIFMRVKAHAAVSETVQAARQWPWAKALVNALLRSYLRQAEDIEQQVDASEIGRYSHPEWLIRRIRQDWPEQAEAILPENNRQAPMALRVNRQKIQRNDYLAKLEPAGLSALALPDCAEGILLQNPVPVEQLPGFDTGLVSVQDGAAQLASQLLNVEPGQRVLDVCAAPGGKTCHLLELYPAMRELVALDVDVGRIQRIQENLARLGLSATLLQGDAAAPETWWDGKPFDRILLDAPCSATGVIRRHPDIKLLRQEADIEAVAALQQRILMAVWPLLSVGGLMLYATCSILKQENEQQIRAFIQNHADAECLPFAAVAWGTGRDYGRQILTGESSMDGFYYALIRKQ